MKILQYALIFLFFFSLKTYAGPSVSPLLFFLRATGSPSLYKMSGVDQENFVPVTVRFNVPPSWERIRELESLGLFFSRYNDVILHSEHIYPARINLDNLDYFTGAEDIIRIERNLASLNCSTLDVSNPQVQASRVWKLEKHGSSIDGSGVTVANIDTGIDIYHPAFFKPDAGVYDWIDVNNSGSFEKGTDCVDLNRNGLPDGNETLSFYDASFRDPLNLMPRTADKYDADIDWLYNDENGNGVRDYGPDAGYSETDPSFGELLFIISDDNDNYRLDIGEKLIGLGTSRVIAIIDKEGVHHRGENLFTNTGDISNHGTGSSGIVGGQVPGRRLTGMAPGVEFIAINQTEVDIEENVLLAKDMGADIFMYEFGNWIFQFLDGSSNLETFISDLHRDNYPQLTASGNLAGPERKKHAVFSLDPLKQDTFTFSVPGSNIKNVFISLLWRGRFFSPSILLQLSSNDSLLITYDEKYYYFGDIKVISGRDTSPKGTTRIDILISSDNPFSGDMSINVENKSRFSALAVDAYIADDVSQWMNGAQFTNFITDDGTVCSPATADSDITVGAYDPRGTRNVKGAINDFSSWGNTIDGRRAVDITAPGTLVYSLSSHYPSHGIPGGYIDFGGTSASLPHVVGCAALIRQVLPGLTSSGLSAMLYDYALTDNFTGPVPNDIWGFGKLRIYDSLTLSQVITAVQNEHRPVPFSVSQSYPNPFNSIVSFDVYSSYDNNGITVTIYNVIGQTVTSYSINSMKNNMVRFTWNGRDSNGVSMPSGMYFFRFTSIDSSIIRKCLMLK
ncbi:S8 family peptidase [bacterium]|nr:S8 family peptidase [bacterium]